jgi:hypothetical protein
LVESVFWKSNAMLTHGSVSKDEFQMVRCKTTSVVVTAAEQVVPVQMPLRQSAATLQVSPTAQRPPEVVTQPPPQSVSVSV